MKSKLASNDPLVTSQENKKISEKVNFRAAAIGDSTKLDYEPCSQTEHELQGQRSGSYMTTDDYGRMCKAPETLTHSLNERGNLYRDGYGWTSDTGCNVDDDSNLRNSRNLTNLRYINQLFERPYNTVPYMGSGAGQGEIGTEDKIRPGLTTGSKKQCNVLAGVSVHPERFNICMYHNPQDTEHIVPKWRWGGDDTRMAMRRENFKKRCGYNY